MLVVIYFMLVIYFLQVTKFLKNVNIFLYIFIYYDNN